MPGARPTQARDAARPADPARLLDTLDDALPQTQCTRCGYADCRAYARAMAHEGEAINRCPPGGAEGIVRLARITARDVLELDPGCGREEPRRVAWIDETACIGCTLCLQACPVDSIAGAPRRMHAVIADWCTGCELCVAPCPTDCIHMRPVAGLEQATGWQAWSPLQADLARARHLARRRRIEAEAQTPAAGPAESPQAADEQARRRQRVHAALERARARQAARA